MKHAEKAGRWNRNEVKIMSLSHQFLDSLARLLSQTLQWPTRMATYS